MTGERLRLAGRGSLPTGEAISWSLADGRAGRRWRELVTIHDRILQAVLLELLPDGRLARLEMTTDEGLLTLHPTDDATCLHGNVVTRSGIQHLTLPWSDRHELLVDRSPASIGAILGRCVQGSPGRPGDPQSVPVVRVDASLVLRASMLVVAPAPTPGWRVRLASDDPDDPDDPGTETIVVLDPRGLVRLEAGVEWPLEL